MARRPSLQHCVSIEEHLCSNRSRITFREAVQRKEPAETWVLRDEWDSGISETCIAGCVSLHEIAMRKLFDSSLYVSNLEDKTSRVVNRGQSSNITSCASLPDGRIVTGLCNSKLEIYDQTGNCVRTIETPFSGSAHVAVSKDGLILAAGWGGSAIHAYDPDEGKRVRTTYVADDIVIFQIFSLPSGDIALRTRCKTGDNLGILSDSGFALTNLHDREILSVSSHETDESLYVLHSNLKRTWYAIDVISFGDEVTTERVIERSLESNQCPSFTVAMSGKLAVCIDGKLYVFEKKDASATLLPEV
ncbi:uncharacterized protein [Diadema antillarum]|uniref:uncharacterized protein n=1 Tax=Diadema antillarum TaxID=105358 RepID=UPI003A836B08